MGYAKSPLVLLAMIDLMRDNMSPAYSLHKRKYATRQLRIVVGQEAAIRETCGYIDHFEYLAVA
jgi:hypothetical protein